MNVSIIGKNHSPYSSGSPAKLDCISLRAVNIKKAMTTLLTTVAVFSFSSPALAQATIDGGMVEIVDGTGLTTTQPAPFAVAWPVGGELVIGDLGFGELQVTNGGEVSNTVGYIGSGINAIGVATVTGAGSAWTSSSVLFVGRYGNGTLNIEDGGTVSNTHTIIGGEVADAIGFVKVTGSGSNLVAVAGVDVGAIGIGTLLIEDGATVSSNSSTIGGYFGSTGTATVTGAGSIWAQAVIAVGASGNGTLKVEDGGTVNSRTAFVGISAGSDGDAVFTGAGSNWLIEGTLTVGYLGDGALTVADGGSVQSGTVVSVGSKVGSTGTINIGAASGDAAVAAGTLDTLWVVFGDGDGSIVFNHTDTAYDFDTSITGAGVVGIESGTTTFSTDHDYSGGTTISGGTLLVDGSVTSDILIGGTGTLGGTGLVGDIFVQSGGTLAPGNSIGTIYATNADFANGSNFDVEINAAGDSDILAVSGDVVINAGATLNITPETLGEDGSSYYWLITYLVIAADSVTGVFDTVTETFSELDVLSVTYEVDQVFVTLINNDIDITSAATTANQIATADAIDSLEPASPIYEAVTFSGQDNAATAFDLLSGEIHPTTQTLLALNSQFALDAAHNHDGGTGLNIWGDFVANWSRINKDGNAATASQSIYGALAGADMTVTGDFSLGIMAGVTNASFDVGARASSGSADAFHVGGYGRASIGEFDLGFGGVYSTYDIATSRTINIVDLDEVLTASYAASSIAIYGEVSRALELQSLTLEPFVNVSHIHLKTDAIAEIGGDAALSTGASTHGLTLVTLGLRANRKIDLNGVAANLSGSIGWQHGFGDLNAMSDMSFDGQPSFAIAGVSAASDTLRLSVGIDIDLGSNFHIAMDYSGQLAGDTQSHGAQFSISKEF